MLFDPAREPYEGVSHKSSPHPRRRKGRYVESFTAKTIDALGCATAAYSVLWGIGHSLMELTRFGAIVHEIGISGLILGSLMVGVIRVQILCQRSHRLHIKEYQDALRRQGELRRQSATAMEQLQRNVDALHKELGKLNNVLAACRKVRLEFDPGRIREEYASIAPTAKLFVISIGSAACFPDLLRQLEVQFKQNDSLEVYRLLPDECITHLVKEHVIRMIALRGSKGSHRGVYIGSCDSQGLAEELCACANEHKAIVSLRAWTGAGGPTMVLIVEEQFAVDAFFRHVQREYQISKRIETLHAIRSLPECG